MKPPKREAVERELASIVKALRPYRPKKILLFGSFARGDYHALSDIDLLIVKESDKKFTDRIVEVLNLCDSTIPLEALVYTPAEYDQLLAEGNSFIDQAVREGRVLYDEAEEGG
jgi:predicted nucleotidyltransferase